MTGQDRLFFADIGEEQTLFDLEPDGPAVPAGRVCPACGGEGPSDPRILRMAQWNRTLLLCSRCRAAGNEPQTLL